MQETVMKPSTETINPDIYHQFPPYNWTYSSVPDFSQQTYYNSECKPSSSHSPCQQQINGICNQIIPSMIKEEGCSSPDNAQMRNTLDDLSFSALMNVSESLGGLSLSDINVSQINNSMDDSLTRLAEETMDKMLQINQ
ncbi:hypothetical protein PGB90_002956 [Kerria lacca]